MSIDYHVHTAYSDDSRYAMEQVAIDAIGKGIEELCFTDHVDYGVKWDWDETPDPEVLARHKNPGGVHKNSRNVDYPEYYKEVTHLQQVYGDKIRLKLGMEFGVQQYTIPRYEKLFKQYPFDFIILSVHQVDDLEFWNQDFQQGRTQQEYNERYYEELLNVVKNFHDYSVLGHLDLIVRYDKQGRYPFEKVRGVVEEILKTVIADGKGIEVNTSSQRYGLDDLTPSRDILRLYRELGGKILTIGSDGHRFERLGVGIDETHEELKALGFTEFCTFDKMVPTFRPL